MGAADHYVAGDYNVICDICGFKYKRSHTHLIKPTAKSNKAVWLVCNACHQECNPQDFVTGIKSRQAVPLARPESTDEAIDYQSGVDWNNLT